jgi:ubiquinone/menaquinone biosynthesis C-methylase UbiE
MGQAVTEALVEYARPAAGMCVLDLASGTGEPAISLAQHLGEAGHVTALDLSTRPLRNIPMVKRLRSGRPWCWHPGGNNRSRNNR